MAGLGAYGQVLADPRARAFTLAGLVARLPMSMTGLGTVLLISIVTGSFGRAGLVVAFSTVAQAIAAPLWGRTIDRVGQARVLVIAAGINALGLSTVIVSVLSGWPLVSTLFGAMLIGFGYSSAGGSVRARWARRLSGTPLLNTAYAWEAVLDEVVFIIGPVLATFLATSIHPALGLVASLVVGITGALLLAAQRDTEPPVRPRAERRSTPEPLPIAVMVPIVGAFAALGALFGSMEVVIVAFATESGVLAYAGLIVMTWASGSLIAGVVVGAITWRATPVRRFRIGAVILGLSVLPLPFAGAAGIVVLVAGLLMLSGLAIAPTLIAANAVTQSSVPASRLTEALGWTSMGIAGGLALGAAAIGQVIDRWSSVGGLWGVVAVGGVLIVAVLSVRPQRADPQISPVSPDTASAESPPAPERTPST